MNLDNDKEYIDRMMKSGGEESPVVDLSDKIMSRIWLEPTYRKIPQLISKKVWLGILFILASAISVLAIFDIKTVSQVSSEFDVYSFAPVSVILELFSDLGSIPVIISLVIVSLFTLLLFDRLLKKSI
jgi:hypothetical protein